MTLKIGKRTFGCVQAYAPTSAAPEAEMIIFYNDLNEAVEEISKCELTFVIGDFNAKIGQPENCDDDVMGKFGFGERNHRGDRLLSFARSHQLFFANTMFEKKASRRFTWSINDVKNEIDFIMFRNNQKNIIKNVEVLTGFEYISDHKMVRARLSLMLKTKRKFRKRKEQIVVVKNESKIKDFNARLRKEMDEDKITSESTQEIYSKLCNNFLSASIPFKVKRTSQTKISTATRQLIKEREELKSLRNQNRESEIRFREKRNICNKLIAKDVRNF